MVTYAPHQQRVVDERAELVDKITKLDSFVAGSMFSTLVMEEQGRLSKQLEIMRDYATVLQARIDAFVV
jgi:hypothetical protein